MMGRELCNNSVTVHSQTFDTPGKITFVNATHDSLVLRWQSPADNSIGRHNYEYAKVLAGFIVTVLLLGEECCSAFSVIFSLFVQPQTDGSGLFHSTLFTSGMVGH